MIDKKYTEHKDQEIINAYFEYFYSYTNRNWQAMISRFASGLTMFGTGIDEVSLNKKDTLSFFAREFDQSPAPLEFEIKELEVFKLSHNVAYLMILMDMVFIFPDERIDCPNNRTTAIMVLEDGEWKLAHGNWSQPAEGQEIGESVPYKLLKERNRILEEKVRERTIEIEKQNIELQNLNKTKTNLLSIIAHDLRSPFNAFMGLTEVMLLNFDENINDKEYFRKRLELINDRARNLFNVADTLLNWAWTQTEEIVTKKEETRVKAIIATQVNILKDLSQRKEISIKDISKEDLTLSADSEILGIIIRNLLSNSIKYSKTNSLVTINYKADNSKNIVIIITDKGIGMSDDRIKEVLSSPANKSTLGTDNEKGTGLGLSICKDLISKIGGRLHISSEIDKGTEVTLTIPIE
ncbi:MAG TPA: ATP-binding protein [Tenuifilaceae bacterium]|nr:ATP-binding protein [Tenuifilaceae bacterium]